MAVHLVTATPTQREARARRLKLHTDIAEAVKRAAEKKLRILSTAHNSPTAAEQPTLSLDAEPVQLEFDYSNVSMTAGVTRKPSHPKIQLIQRAVAHWNNLKLEDMLSGRGRNVVLPRQVSMYLCKKLTGRSYQEIGYHHGGRDRKTVIYGITKVKWMIGERSGTPHKQIKNDMAIDFTLAADIEKLTAQLRV